jgi:hypothetical protein
VAISRRRFVVGAALAPLALRLAPDAWARSPGAPLRALTDHEGDVVEAATARLIPGPTDDPLEAGSPGAREANVVGYIDAFLSAFDDDPPRIYAGGPFSGRHGGDGDDFADFAPLSALQERWWRGEIARLQRVYRQGVAALDAAAGGSYASADPLTQDLVLANDATGFRDVLFDHAIEGWLAAPEYGGNSDGAGWRAVAFDGDVCPDGYTDDEVSGHDGLDLIDPTGIVAGLLAQLQDVLGA